VDAELGGVGAQVLIERAPAAVRIGETAEHRAVDQSGENRCAEHCADAGQQPRERRGATEPEGEGRAVNERESRDPFRMENRERLGDRAAGAVADETGRVDAQIVEEETQPFGMCGDRERGATRPVAASGAKLVEDDQSMSRRHERDNVMPEMRRAREAVEEDHRLARASGTGGIVVEPAAGHVDEFTAHGGKMGRGPMLDKRSSPRSP
jgi:hypothetical protein